MTRRSHEGSRRKGIATDEHGWTRIKAKKPVPTQESKIGRCLRGMTASDTSFSLLSPCLFAIIRVHPCSSVAMPFLRDPSCDLRVFVVLALPHSSALSHGSALLIRGQCFS